jgi:membrane-bound inhibitor of C-type lysozyme
MSNVLMKKTWCSIGRLGAVTLLTTSLASCVAPGIEETRLPQRIDYRCTNNKLLSIQRAPDASTAAVLINEKAVVLPRAGSAAQEKYSDGNYTLYLQGERAMLEENSQVLFGPCRAGPLPKKMVDGFSGP